jgi:hypothetical protein
MRSAGARNQDHFHTKTAARAPLHREIGAFWLLAQGFTLILRLQRFDWTKKADNPLQLSVGANYAEINAFHQCLAISANKLPGEPQHSMMEVCMA